MAARHEPRRGGAGAFLLHLHPPRIPARRASAGFTLCLGGLAFHLFLVSAVTGILLMVHYRPDAPYVSVREIAEWIPYGDLVRNLHYWAGQGMVVLMLLHMVRVVVTGSYQGPKRRIWAVGALLAGLVLVADFTGYLLRFDRETFWAGYVALRVVRAVPLAGPGLHRIAAGTETYGAASVRRIHLWHCVVLPLAVAAFVSYHFWKVRRAGGAARPL